MNKIKLLFNKETLLATRNLSVSAVICIFTVTIIYLLAANRIAAQITNATLSQFHNIAPELEIDKSLLDDMERISLKGYQVDHFQATEDGHVQVDFLRATTSKGYSGDITLLIGISANKQTLLGVRTLAHKETPGLGDKIDARISPWIHQFDGLRIKDTRFAVSKDGGDFDAFTGATITPRAVTELVGDITQAWYEKEHHEREREHRDDHHER